VSNEVEQIKAKLDVVDIISEYVRLKQSGVNWKGLCPFHGEKSPSFMVHREKQIWHCFGCGEGGDIFSFVQKVENMDFPDTLELLARKAGVTLERRGVGSYGDNRRTRLFQATELAAGFFREQLTQNPQSEPARRYLDDRRVIGDSVATFGIGYAPPEWDKLLIFLRGKDFSVDEVVAAGLALKSERGPGAYDRFRDRLMFPIAEAQGRVVGFGGRTLDSAAKEAHLSEARPQAAKYINSPQGPIYNKSGVLYNLDRAKTFIKEAGHAVLVEGYMDVVASHQAGVKNVVATSGTALTADQVKLLKRYTNEIRLAFDADLAGQSASERGIDLALQAELEVKMIVLPFGKDPDECAKQDASAYREAVVAALPIGDYAFRTVLGQVDVATREGKKEAAKRLTTAIAKLPDPVERDYYIKRLASELQVDERALRERLAALPVRPAPPVSELKAPPTPVIALDRQQLLAERLLGLVLHFGELAQALGELLPEHLPEGRHRELYRHMLVNYTERQRIELDELRLELGAEVELLQFLDHLFFQGERDFGELESSQARSELTDVVRHLRIHYLSFQLKRLAIAIREAEAAGQAEVLQELLSEYTEQSRELARFQA